MSATGYRTSASCQLQVLESRGWASYRGALVDISPEGAQLLCPAPVPLGATVKMTVEGFEMGEQDARVIGNAGDAGRGYLLSLRLVEASWPYQLFSSLLTLSSTLARPAEIPTPPCLVELGLQLPCTAADVRRVFDERVRKAHPDRGGDVEQFVRLRAVYLEALDFLGRA